ncbi:hypothetical protein DFH09DRAFT_1088879 [Mycena vulgaris]|nr:hypothetical protein DFH09DRAFT_1088879 [Mycena vulgaris]
MSSFSHRGISSAESFFIAHQAETFAAFDRRFTIFMKDNTPGMFILSYLLDPISPLEMCEERKASKMAVWSTAKRNGLSADYIINMGILEQYWKYGFNNSGIYMHTSRLSLENFDGSSEPRSLGSDSLRRDFVQQSRSYGRAALDEDEDDGEEDGDMEPVPVIFVNLEAPAVLDRLNLGPKNVTGSTSSAHSIPVVTPKAKWAAQNATWGKDDGG